MAPDPLASDRSADFGAETHDRSPVDPPRSWWQFSLRTMLIVTALVAGLFGFWIAPAERQRRIVDALHESQGNVDYHKPSAFGVPGLADGTWVDDWLPVDYARAPSEVNLLANYNCTAADLELCTRLPSLHMLSVSSRTICDKDLVPLTQLTSLKVLDLDVSQVTPAGLSTVAQLKSLRSLRLKISPAAWSGMPQLSALPEIDDFTLDQMEDSGLDYLPDFPKLRSLSLYMTRVSGKRIAVLARYPNLEQLNLAYTDIDDEGLAALTSLTALKTLNLMDTQVTDRGLGAIARFSSLEILSLSNTKVTASGLEQLAALKNLLRLNLVYARVSRDDVARLHAKFPGCRISSHHP